MNFTATSFQLQHKISQLRAAINKKYGDRQQVKFIGDHPVVADGELIEILYQVTDCMEELQKVMNEGLQKIDTELHPPRAR